MTPDISFEQYCAYISTLGINEVKDHLLHFDGPLNMDFTKEYLDTMDIEKLRHILVAAMVTVELKKKAF